MITMWKMGNVAFHVSVFVLPIFVIIIMGLSPPVTGIKNEVVCGDVDIRNNVKMFKQKLRNCTVIEGFLKIVLIDYADPSDYGDLSFPNLREITDFLLLYRVYGLKTLSHIFPNLTVIRGHNLFYNYALVVFEMPNFEDIGLYGLTTIQRGAVRLDKNPNLCYIDTIDWTKITKLQNEDNFFFQNRRRDECPNVCRDKCPTMRDVEYDRFVNLCWNQERCQRVCNASCSGPCYEGKDERNRSVTKCCHESCLGGCSGDGPENCFACKDVHYNERCRERCPTGTYKYLDRRCLKKEECEAIKKPLPWKVLERVGPDESGVCAQECPVGFTGDKTNPHGCVRCDGPCPKVCQTKHIDNVAAAQELKGCTVIFGQLEIQIQGGSYVGRELEESLGAIEEVTHFIKIANSHALISLSFFKNLKIIGGNRLHTERYALFVLDNQNLQDIWDFTSHPKLTIEKGVMFFQMNRKLCMSKILEFRKHVYNTDDKPDPNDISPNNNGDLAACDTVEITLQVASIKPSFAILNWTNFHAGDYRELLGWLINYREAPAQNLTVFNARDACGGDEWKSDDLGPNNDTKAKFMASYLYNLKPFTQYAVYVQTLTTAKAERGAISPIVYFTTKPGVPSPARDIVVTPLGNGELRVQWTPPLKPNGNVTHYYVYWQPYTLNPAKFEERNYCVDKLRLTSSKKTPVVDPGKNQTKPTTPVEELCPCPKSEEQESLEATERAFQIEFEDYLQNTIYQKRPVFPARKRKGNYSRPMPTDDPNDLENFEKLPEKLSRKKRVPQKDLKEAFESIGSHGNFTDYKKLIGNITRNFGNLTVPDEDEHSQAYEASVVYGKTEVILSNLNHFQEYSIEVIACHEFEVGMDEKKCSNRAITTARTNPKADADTIDRGKLTHNINNRRVTLKWPEVVKPNGLIVSYDIELGRVDNKDFKPETLCIPHVKYREDGGGYVIGERNAGNWTYRVRANSLAGNGSWTTQKYFFIAADPVASGHRLELILGLVAALLVVIIAVVAGAIYYVTKRRPLTSIPSGLIYTSVNPDYWSDVYVADDWEVDRDKIEMLKELGQGSFGMVWEGIYNQGNGIEPSKVAVKTVNEKASIRDRIEFLNEASVMKAFSCNHVVRLLGVVSKGQPTLVVMELMGNGDLKTYLRLHRPDYAGENSRKPPTLKQILQMAGEIADGMSYLGAKKYVHRDLAARNCMVDHNKVVKIGDFGMTRDIYQTDYYRKGGKGLLPVRWMAPESLKDGIFTSQSDVWSYGVVMWEMATLAAQPYQGLANEQVLHYVVDGGIMERPEKCPDKLYNLMKKCWRHEPKARPTFCELIEELIPDLSPTFKDSSFFFSDENTERPSNVDYDEFYHDDEGETGEHTPLTGSPLHHVGGASSSYRGSDGDHLDNMSLHSSELSYESRRSSPRQDFVTAHSNNRDQSSHSRPPLFSRAGANARGGANNLYVSPVGGAENNTSQNNTDSEPSNPGSAIHSNEGSKESSKSSNSSHRVNGLSNGHIPTMFVQQEC